MLISSIIISLNEYIIKLTKETLKYCIRRKLNILVKNNEF